MDDPNIPPAITITDETCNGGDGMISVSSDNPHIEYLWGDSTTASYLDSLNMGTYYLTITNTACNVSSSDSFIVHPSLVYDVNTEIGECDGLGSAYISYNNGNNFTAAWSNGTTGDTISGIPPAWYSVSVTDGQGCQSHQNVELQEDLSCKVHISGYILNKNFAPLDCNMESTDISMAELVSITNGTDTWSTYSDVDGYYEFIGYPDNYDISLVYPDNDWTFHCGTNGVLSVAATTDGEIYTLNNIAFSAPADLEVKIFNPVAVIGQPFLAKVRLRKTGAGAIDNITIEYKHDEQLIFNNAVQPNNYTFSYDSDNRTVSIDVPNIGTDPLTQNIFFDFTVDPTTITPDPARDSAWVYTTTQEINPNNNFDDDFYMMVGSYDPNDKNALAFPNDLDIEEGIKEMVYRINFQNEGDYKAFDVVVKDELDLNTFDLRQFEIIDASHNYSYDIENGNTLVFSFNDIDLPTKDEDPEESKGFIVFNIGLQPTISVGDRIKNDAAIYFDYNAPIITNETNNLIITSTVNNILEHEIDIPLEIFPNPAHDKMNISFEWVNSNIVHFELYNILGEQVLRKELNANLSEHSIFVNHLPNGQYIIKISDGHSFIGKRMIISH